MVTVKRFLSLASESLMGTTETVIELKQAAVGSIALEVALLLAGMVQSLRIRPSKGPQLIVTLIDSDRISKAVVTREPDNTVSFAIGRNQAEYLHAVLLRAYRDQMAEVNHVHIEGQSDAAPFDLTVMFEVAREPMTSEDAKKLLDE
jgi:hypothetical protein